MKRIISLLLVLGLFTGFETNTLKINEVYQYMYNYEFYCVIRDSNGRILNTEVVKVQNP